MIRFGTILNSRGDKPAIRVIAIDSGHYIVEPALEFGAPFPLTVQQILSRYEVPDGTIVDIVEDTETAAYKRLSTETYSDFLKRSRQKGRREAAAPTPEQAFAAAEAEG